MIIKSTGESLLGSTGPTSSTGATGATGAAGASIKTKNYWRQVGTSPWEIWYVGTNVNNYAPNAAQTPAAQVLSAYPVFFPKASFIDYVAFYISVAGDSSQVGSIGIYANKSDTNLYPAALLFDSGPMDTTSATTLRSAAVSPSLSVSANSIIWMSSIFAAATNRASMRAYLLAPTLGTGAAFGSNPIRTTLAFTVSTYAAGATALPNPFPQGASTGYANAAAIGFRLAAS